MHQEMEGLRNGAAQKEYELLENQQVNSKNEISTLKGEIERAIQKLKSWQLNPEVANALGFFRISACGSEKDLRDLTNSDMKKKEAERDGVRRELNILKEKFSPAVMDKIRNSSKALADEVTQLRTELEKINKEIVETKNLYLARKEAERLALEQTARDREAQAKKQAEEQNKAKNSQDNSTMFFIVAAAIGGYLLLNNNSKNVVKVKV